MKVLIASALALALGVGGAHAQQAAPAPAKPAAKAAPAKPATKKQVSPYKPVVEQRAMDLIKAMSATLAAAKSMSFTATVGYEFPSKLGPPLVFTTRYDVAMQRPDKLRILTVGDGPTSEFYYDGKTMTAYAPVENLAAVAAAPANIDDALQAAQKNAAIFFPFMDVVAADPYKAFNTDVVEAFYIGTSTSVGGVPTTMVAWANNDVFLQMWIGTDDKLPRRIRAQYRTDKLKLRHELELSNWKLDPAFPPETFASAKAASAGKMNFAAPSPPPKGVKSIAPAKGTK
ncbi:MAG: DUF2092 domain-containing protein [Burkholderiales bacterium]